MPPHRIVNIEDLRLAARRRVPRVVFDYVDGGADGEITMRENMRAFEAVWFRPRSAVKTPECDLTTTVAGIPLSLPFLLAPIGSSRMLHPRGEERASAAAGARPAPPAPATSCRRSPAAAWKTSRPRPADRACCSCISSATATSPHR
jgi:isopentenyl diphosphate isomerase/L-lactate dehydrogenase-like FMN-dependent dehydrogenase